MLGMVYKYFFIRTDCTGAAPSVKNKVRKNSLQKKYFFSALYPLPRPISAVTNALITQYCDIEDLTGLFASPIPLNSITKDFYDQSNINLPNNKFCSPIIYVFMLYFSIFLNEQRYTDKLFAVFALQWPQLLDLVLKLGIPSFEKGNLPLEQQGFLLVLRH